MSSNNLVAALFLILSISLTGPTSAQDNTPQLDFGSGALEEAAPEVEKLLQLAWDGDNLTLKRDWDQRLNKGNKKPADELKEMIKELVQKGVPEVHAAQLAEHTIAGVGGKKSEVEKAFFAVGSKFGLRSSGSSGGGNRRKIHFSNESLSGTANLSPDRVRFEFAETHGQQRSFELTENEQGKLKIEFQFDEQLLRFLQIKDGKTQLICITSEKTVAYVGDSFSDFAKRNPLATEQLLLPLLDRLGIKKPIDQTDPDVLSVAIHRLQSQAATDPEKLERLLKDLDSDNYQARTKASEELSGGYEEWSARIKEYSTNTKLSLEARFRLKEIIEKNSSSPIGTLINDQNLLESPEFLIAALEFADDQKKTLVVKQLEKVTKQSFGTDIEAWKTWVKKNK